MAERRLHILNNSRGAAFRRCPRLHYYSYELGYVRRALGSDPRVTGSRWHAALEAWWTAVAEGRQHEALEAALAALETADDPYEQARAEAVLTGYHTRWIDEPIDVLGVEVPFEGPLLDPITGDAHPEFVVGGTLDGIVRVGGRVLVLEHKTTSQDFSPGSYYWEKLTLNSQVSMYMAAGAALGLHFDGCLYDVIGKAPDISPRLATPEAERKYTKAGKLYACQRDTDEPVEEFRARLLDAIAADPGKFYARGEVTRIGDELEKSLIDVWQVAELISEARARSRWPRNTDACFAFNRACDFWPVCAHGESLENSELFVNERNPNQ